MLAVAIPVGLDIFSVFLLYAALVRRFDPGHYLLIAGSTVVLLAAVLLAVAARRDRCRVTRRPHPTPPPHPHPHADLTVWAASGLHLS